MVSVSTDILRAAVISYSLRGDEFLLMSAQTDESYKLNAVSHGARTIVVFDEASLPVVKDAIATAREDLICPPNLVVCDNYIGEKSILLLKRELGLD
ncbi:hypothetical protein [Phormidium tenue]|uniref:hypothetical protein n=1 Tax=Phormidium tenue TaxID=126344 RepID=UPI0018EF736D|nr:hypothetical protein [Phormidium tenue]